MLVLMTALALAAKCPVPGDIPAKGKPLVRVEGHAIQEPLVRGMLATVPLEEIEGQSDAEILRGVAMTHLLYKQAMDNGIMDDPEVANAINAIIQKAIATEWMRKIAEGAATPEKVEAFLEENPAANAGQVHARHILVETEELANRVMQQLADGAEFAQLAALFSKDPGSGQAGGDLGWFSPGVMVPPFAEAVQAAEIGVVVGPVESQFGYHVIQVLERADGPDAETMAQIEMMLQQQAVGKVVEAWDLQQSVPDDVKLSFDPRQPE